MTLQRTTVDAAGTVTVAQSLTLPAWVRANYPQDLDDGSVRENRVVVSSTHLLAAEVETRILREDGSLLEREDGGALLGEVFDVFSLPAKDDRILIQGDPSNIQNVAPFYYGGTLVRVELICRG